MTLFGKHYVLNMTLYGELFILTVLTNINIHYHNYIGAYHITLSQSQLDSVLDSDQCTVTRENMTKSTRNVKGLYTKQL